MSEHADLGDLMGSMAKGTGDLIGGRIGAIKGLGRAAGDIAQGHGDQAMGHIAEETDKGSHGFNNALAATTADASDALGGFVGQGVGQIRALAAGAGALVSGHGDEAGRNMTDTYRESVETGKDTGRSLGESLADGSAFRKGGAAIVRDTHDAVSSVGQGVEHAMESAAGAVTATAAAPGAALHAATDAVSGRDGGSTFKKDIDKAASAGTGFAARNSGVINGAGDAIVEHIKGGSQAALDVATGKGGAAREALGEGHRKAKARFSEDVQHTDEDIVQEGVSGIGKAVERSGRNAVDAAMNPVVMGAATVASGGSAAALTTGLAASTAAWSASDGVIDATIDHSAVRQARKSLAKETIDQAMDISGRDRQSATALLNRHYPVQNEEALGAAIAKDDPELGASYGL